MLKILAKKIKTVFKSKGESGKPLCTCPPYGYKKDEKDSNKWIVDENASKVIKQIFQLCMEGNGPTQIANILKEQKVLTPASYYNSIGLPTSSPNIRNLYNWSGRTVAH